MHQYGSVESYLRTLVITRGLEATSLSVTIFITYRNQWKLSEVSPIINKDII